MTEQKDTFWLTVSQPVCPALSRVNMEAWIGGNGHETCLGRGGLLWEAFNLSKDTNFPFIRIQIPSRHVQRYLKVHFLE